MPSQENIETLRSASHRFSVKDLDGYLAMYSNSVIHHGYSSRIRPGITGLKEHYVNLFKGFPDLTVDIDDIIAEGEKVAHRFTFRGTHRGEFLGIPPTGNLVTAPGMQMNLFFGGKCIEVWSVHDSFRFLSQIGAVPKLRDTVAK